MHNMIKMDLYRMFKAKVLYITVLIAVVSVIASLGSAKYQLEHPEFQDMLEEAMEQTGDLNVGIQAGGTTIISDDTATEDIYKGILSGGISLAMGVIFCVVFVCTEHNSGFIKNVVSRKNYRSQMSVSKAIIMAIYTLVIFTVCTAVFLLGHLLLFQGLKFANVSNFIGYIAVQILIQTAIMNLCILLCNLVRNMAFSMAMGICISAGLFSLVTGLIDRFNLPINTSDYLLSVLMRILPATYDSTLYTRAVIISAGCILVSQVASLITMKKQDVK